MNISKNLTDLNLEEQESYRRFVISLISPPQPKTEEQTNLLHMCWGLIGEIVEMRNSVAANTTDNLLKEAGDVMFYLFSAGYFINAVPDIVFHAPSRNPDELEDKIWVSVELFMDIIKKIEFYNDPDPDLIPKLKLSYRHLSHWVTSYVAAFFNIREVIDANYTKLKTRHKDGFSIESSRAKVDEQSS